MQVSESHGTEDGLKSNNFSVCENKLCKCWSFVNTVDTSWKPTVKTGFWPSIQFISGPEFWKTNLSIMCENKNFVYKKQILQTPLPRPKGWTDK